jgi:hypothetical protein
MISGTGDTEIEADESKPFVFPTASRTKHSKLVSYPVGAEVLSRAFDGVPQHQAITCSFVAGNPQRTLTQEQTRVLDIRYRRRDRSFHDGENADSLGVFQPKWEIWVYDVPVALRHEIKTRLVEDALPNAARNWLIKQAALDGKFGDAAICFDYNKIDKVLLVSEGKDIAPEKIR